MPSPYTLTPTDVAALEDFARHHGRSWKSELRAVWMSPGGFKGPFAPILLRLRSTWGPQGLEKYKRPDLAPEDVVKMPQPIPEGIFKDARWFALEHLKLDQDLRAPEQRARLAGIAETRCERMGHVPGPDLDRAQMLWMRSYHHLMSALLDLPIL